MNWLSVAEILYLIVLIAACLRIIYDTRSVSKTLAYLLFAIFVPVIGMLFYFSFGINYRNRKMYSKKLMLNDALQKELTQRIYHYTNEVIRKNDEELGANKELATMLLHDIESPLTANNAVKILLNGEEKFPEVIEAIKSAKHHIHFEYYIYEDDTIGREIEELLKQKVREGVAVRFIYDDFGSRSIRKNLVNRLRDAGVEAYPFFKITFIPFANRLNYRNHRKIIVIDGETAFVGGINVSDRYINSEKSNNKIFWRDTHLRIDGPGIRYLQYLFLCDWNFCAKTNLMPDENFFPPRKDLPKNDTKIVQIAASGPDSSIPTILFSYLQAITLAKEEILITNPYFIPGESLLDVLMMSALSNVKVKIIVPGISDSKLVNIASYSYFSELLAAGAEIYKYKKGFIHAKTMILDNKVAIVGTANMDVRSFNLNFEVNAIVYSSETANELRGIFYEDLKHCEKIDLIRWEKRPLYKKFIGKFVRLMSPML